MHSPAQLYGPTHLMRRLPLISAPWPHPRPSRLGCSAVHPIFAATGRDLHRWAPEGDAWSVPPERWVVFSDLHFGPRTESIGLEVLRRVHELAAARSAGILFLGDFWHSRGALPVGPLNSVVRLFNQEWHRPTLMLVGNHDQASLGGMVHALTPLAAASPRIHVFDAPSLYAGALWLPYRRDSGELQAAIEAAGAASAAAGDGGIKAVFAHADVVGASLNNAYQARDGLPPRLFPAGVPTYTGHYHKPHTVPGTVIRYVGSPYQVSRSEAGQQKALLVLDSDWRVVEEVPLDIGPRHFEAAPLQAAGEALAAAEVPEDLRRGDRLRLTLPFEGSKAERKKLLKQLQAKGVEVEVVAVPAPAPAPRIPAAENLSPEELFTRYAALLGMRAGAAQRGVDLLHALPSAAATAQQAQQAVALSFKSVEVEGYFSFKGATRYNLSERGLVVVSGRIEGTASGGVAGGFGGMESNGAGKTALVMAPLWALTGDVDARSELGVGRGLTNGDVVHEDSKVARVTVEGVVNGEPFTVERRAVRRGRGGGLRFELGGQDLTGAEMRLTQTAIDAALGTQLLSRAVFYGQSEITFLLECSDRDFKEELGKVVDLGVWAAAKEAAKSALSAARAALVGCDKELEVRRGYVRQFAAQLAEAEGQAAAWEAERGRRQAEAAARLKAAVGQLLRAEAELAARLELLERLAGETCGGERQVESGEVEWRLRRAQMDALVEEHWKEVEQLEGDLAAAEGLLRHAQLRSGATRGQAAEKARVAAEYEALLQGEALHGHVHGGGAVCDRCLQPIDSAAYLENRRRLQQESDQAADAASAAGAEASEVQEAAARAALALHAARGRQAAAQRQLSMEQEAAAQQRQQRDAELAAVRSALATGGKAAMALETALARARAALAEDWPSKAAPHDLLHEHLEASPGSLSAATLALQRAATRACDAAEEGAAAALRSWDQAQRGQNPSASEAARLRSLLATESDLLRSLAAQHEGAEAEAEELKAVDDAFKPTGVVSYVVEGALGVLQDAAGRHLEALAPGISLELTASRPKGGPASSADVVEQVGRRILVQVPGSSEGRPRSVKQLSGGERRRVALALALGFSEAARRGRLRCDLLVLDEAMQHLDGEGCARAASLLRSLEGPSTVLVVAQASSSMAERFDAVDVVVRGAEGSAVEAGGR